MTVPAWSDLSSDDQLSLLSAANLRVETGCELVDTPNRIATDDVSEFLLPAGGSVQWNGSATVHRIMSGTLGLELVWNRDLMRVYRTYTDDRSGVSCRASKGVFVMSATSQDLAATSGRKYWQTTGQDLIAWLDRPIDSAQVFEAGTNIVAALPRLFPYYSTATVSIDPFNKAALFPTTLVYPLPSVGDGSAAPISASLPGAPQTDSSGGTTWLQIINDLLGLLNYQPVWVDADGVYQCGWFLPFAQRDSVFGFDAVTANIVSQARSITPPSRVFNEWRFLNSTLPDGADGLPVTPTEGNGVTIRQNLADGPSAISNMSGPPLSTTVTVAAANQQVLESIADAYVASNTTAVQTATVTTRSFPAASHFDVFDWTDAALEDGRWKVAATSWTEPLDGGSTQWTWTKVAGG